MSKDNVKQMFAKIEKDAALKNKYAELMKEHQKYAENQMAEKLIEFGKTSGFTFSKDDLAAARAELIDKVNSNKELADGDLSNVAGGGISQKAYIVVTSIFSYGMICAVNSLAYREDPGGCGKFMSTTQKC